MFCSLSSIDHTGVHRINKINELVYRLARDDDLSDLSPSQDPTLLYEWYEWSINLYPLRQQVGNAMWVFCDSLTVDQHSFNLFAPFDRNPFNENFSFVFQPIQDNTKPSARSPLFYQCILNVLYWK